MKFLVFFEFGFFKFEILILGCVNYVGFLGGNGIEIGIKLCKSDVCL